jgi:hypothetical protein
VSVVPVLEQKSGRALILWVTREGSSKEAGPELSLGSGGICEDRRAALAKEGRRSMGESRTFSGPPDGCTGVDVEGTRLRLGHRVWENLPPALLSLAVWICFGST